MREREVMVEKEEAREAGEAEYAESLEARSERSRKTAADINGLPFTRGYQGLRKQRYLWH